MLVRIKNKMFTKLSDKSPPYDVALVVRGKDDKYAIAFNECYPPDVQFTQLIETKNRLTFSEMPFTVEEWCEIDEI